ncbi:MAG: hypothetical protein Q9216_004673 [Gyalolechia sp. 2 TL-2023]
MLSRPDVLCLKLLDFTIEPVPAADLASTAQRDPYKKLPNSERHESDDDRTLHQSTQHSIASTYDGTKREGGDLEKADRPRLSTADGKQQQPPNPNIVEWNGPDDPEKPTNWPASRKYGIVAITSIISFLTPLASSMFAPGIPELMTKFGSDNVELASFVVSVYILGYAFGPIVIAPVSELYGRLPVYHVCNILFVVLSVACALSSSLNMFIVWRFFEGLFGSSPLTLGGGTIADMVIQEKRGSMMAIFAIGPVAGGYLTQAKGWRWVFWLIAIVAGAIAILALILLRETYPTGPAREKSQEDTFRNWKSRHKEQVQPSQFSWLSSTATCTFSSPTISPVIELRYQFSPGTAGLTFLGIGVGMLFGLFLFGAMSDRIVKMKSKNGEMKPEYRLPPMIPGAFLIPIGLFLYGWTADKHIHWIAPIIGTGLLGLGLMSIFLPVTTYLVDAFTLHAASATAASTILRSLLGALLPLAGRTFIAVALCPIPVIFYRFGERIRKHPRFQVKL